MMIVDYDSQMLLPPPRYRRPRFLVPVPLYGDNAQLLLPRDMTDAEARKIARIVLAYAGVTTTNVQPMEWKR